MSRLECPTCWQIVSDHALDAGQCPFCGYDGAMVIRASAKRVWMVATLVVVGGGLALGAFLLVPSMNPPRRAPVPEVAAVIPAPVRPVVPPAVQIEQPVEPEIAPEPRVVLPEAKTVVVEPPKKNPWNPAPPRRGPVIRVDAREVREKQINNPDGIVLIPDMNRDAQMILTGKVGLLKIGTVSGKAILDASGLEAEEIVITGDVNENAVVKLNAPNGKATIGGHVDGNAQLTVNAPGGDVIVLAGSGKLAGHATVTVVTKNIEVNGSMLGDAKLILTLTAGGTARMSGKQDNATVIHK